MLYIVGTPIGNLKEFNNNAIETLNKCDYILCEDTRTSQVLLNNYGIKKPLKSYHKFNETKVLSSIVNDLKIGKEIALISDAGMPCVSDPGNILINELKHNNLKYTVVSGPSALINAFILSGFSAPFTFIGFLPEKLKAQDELFNEIKSYKTCLIFYVSCHDIKKTSEILYNHLGNRKVCYARELTKLYEDVIFDNLENGYTGIEKGEFVVVVDKPEENNELLNLTIKEHLMYYINLGIKKIDAIKLVSKERKIKKDDVYKVAIDLNE